MTERWQRYFACQDTFNAKWLKAAVMHWGFHEILYGMIAQHSPPSARILDVGCGPGWSDLYLSSAGYEVTGVDNDESLVAVARGLAARMGVATKFEQADAFDLKKFHDGFDLVYSCGVLEHFDREVTVQLLQEQAKCAPRVLIQIPTKYTRLTGKITDERIYTIRALAAIMRDAGLHVEAAFGYGDLSVTTGQIWLRRLLPRALWRWLQNQGYCFSIAVLGMRG